MRWGFFSPFPVNSQHSTSRLVVLMRRFIFPAASFCDLTTWSLVFLDWTLGKEPTKNLGFPFVLQGSWKSWRRICQTMKGNKTEKPSKSNFKKTRKSRLLLVLRAKSLNDIRRYWKTKRSPLNVSTAKNCNSESPKNIPEDCYLGLLPDFPGHPCCHGPWQEMTRNLVLLKTPSTHLALCRYAAELPNISKGIFDMLLLLFRSCPYHNSATSGKKGICMLENDKQWHVAMSPLQAKKTEQLKKGKFKKNAKKNPT